MKKILVILFVLLNIFKVNVMADETLKNIEYKFGERLEHDGVSSQNDFYFDVKEGWDIKEVNADILFTQSNLTIGEKSSITFSINGIEVHSMWLTDKFDIDETVKIPIDKKYIKIGKNKLSIATTRRISNLPCEDDMNKANWMNISENSSVDIQYIDNTNKLAIKNFIDVYTQEDKLNILLAKNSEKELEAAMNLIAYTKKDSDVEKVDLDIYTAENLYKEQNKVIISDINNLPLELLKFLNESEIEKAKAGCFIKNISFEKFNFMLVVGIKIDKGVKFLGNKQLVNQIQGDSFSIDEILNLDESIKYENMQTFRDMGYEDSMMRGPFINISNFYFKTDGSKKIKNSNINLKFRYSQNIDFERSLITVFINDNPVASKKLEKDLSNGDFIDLSIPDNLLNQNSFNIRVEFDLAIKGDYCDPRGSQTPWAFIDSSSAIMVEYEAINNDRYILDFPYKFTNNGAFEDMKIVVPSYDNLYLEILANTALKLGDYIINNSGNINLENLNSYNGEKALIIGTSKEVAKDLNHKLYVKFDESFTSAMNDKDSKVSFSKEYFEKIALLQNIDDSFVITAVNEESLKNAIYKINSKDIFVNKNTDLLTIHENGDVKGFDLDENIKSDNNSNTKKLDKEQISIFLVITSVILTAIVITIVNLIRKSKE